MAGNLYDEALTALDQRPPATLPSPTPTPATPAGPSGITDPGILAEFQRRRQTGDFRLRSSFRQAGDTTPDQAADARRLAIKFGAPPSVVLRDLDQYRQREASATAVAQTRDTPHLAGWLSDPDNSAVSHDDLPALGAMETGLAWGGKLLGAVKAGYYGISAGMTGAVQGAAEFAIRSGQVQYEADYAAPERASYGLRADQTTQKGEGFFGPLRRPDGGVMTEFSIADSENPKLRGSNGEYLDYPTLVPTLTAEEVQTLVNLPEGQPVPQPIKDKAEAFALSRIAQGKPVFASPTEQQRNLYPQLAREGLPSDAIATQPEAILQLHLIRQHLQEKAEQVRGVRGTGLVERGVLGGVESLTQSAILLPLSILTGSPAPLLAGMGASTGGTSYGQTRDAGGSVALSAARGGFDATVEIATEYIPTKWFLGDLATNAPLRTILFHQLASEVPSEEIATALQDLSEFVALHPDASPMDYVKARPGAFAETLIATVVSAGLQSGGAHLAGAATEKLVNGLGQAATASKTQKRSPEAVESFVAQATKDSPSKAVYAPVDTWTTYWQSKGEDPAAMATSLTGDPQAYQKAVELGTDLEIPIAKYAAKLAGTEHNTFFAQELKLDPAEMNAREAAAHVEQLRQQQEAAQPTEPAQPSTLDQATDLMTQRMVEQGIPQDTAQTYGAIWRAGIGTLASNFGIDPLALQAQYGPQGGPTITREGMEPAPQPVPAPADMPVEQAPEGVPVEAPTPEPQAPDTILGPGAATTLAQGPNPSDFLTQIQRLANQPFDKQAFFQRVAQSNEPTRRQMTPQAFRTELERQAIENGHPFVVYDENGTRRELSDAEEFGYQPKEGETLGIEMPEGLRVLADNGGKTPERVLYQGEPGGPRAEIRFGADRQFNIHLLEHADLSSFLHETGHFFLEVFGDLTDQLAARDALTPEQQRLRDDHAALLTWLGVESRAQIGREQHEQFARGFEAYLMEGKAPSLELRSAFARARAWLLGIYRHLRNLNVTLTPEVRGIFDRLLASDAAIQQAQQTASVSGMFLTAELAGMTDAGFADYLGTIADASRKATEEIDRQILAEVHREQTATWKAQREQIKEQVTTEVQQQPVYRALAAMQKGTHPSGAPLIDGETTDPLKLSKTIISERYGAERLKSLPKPYIYSRDGGLDPDTVAEMFGFSSGDALLTAVSTAPSMRSVIERETAGRMFQQHGSLLLDGTLGEKAQAAVANDSREAVIRKELKALHTLQRKGAATLKAAIPSMTAIRQGAAQLIARTGISEIKPQLYWSAGLRAGRQAVELAAQQKFPEAVRAKQQQLFNLALYREAVKQRDEMETRKGWVNNQNKAAGRQRLADAGGSYLDQWDGFMDRYEFTRVPQNVLDRRARLDKWIASQKAEGLAIDLPDALLDDSRRINYRQMTVEEFIGLTDGLKQLVHFATLKRKLLGRQAARELDDIGNTVADRLYSTAKAGTTGPRLTRHKSMLDKVAKYGRDLGASFFNADTILRELDGWEDLGPVYEHLKGGIDRAVVEDFIPRTNATAEALSTINSVYKRGELQKRVEITALNDSLTREEMIAFALNWGTADNRAALLESKKWAAIGANEQTAHAILDKLDKRDWDYIQSVWDHVETYWPDIEASQKRRKGVAPPKVEAAPIDTKYGSYRGGYYPLKYDSEGDILTRQDAIEDTLERMRTGRYAAAATKAGFAQERIGSGGRPVLLSLSVIAQHVGEVNYDLALGDEIRAVDRILRHKTVRTAFEATGRQGMHEALDLWLHDVATGEIAAADAVSRGSRWIRSGLTVSALALNMGTAAMNVGAPAQSAVVIGKRAMLRGMTDLVTHKWIGEGNIFQQITEASPFMAERQTSFNKDITTAMQTIRDSRIPSWVGKFYFYFITKSQWLADSATWLGAHQKGLVQFESDSEKAAAYADRMVTRSQASGLWADRTAIERGTLSQTTRQSEFVKLWSTLMSYMLAKANVAYEKTASRNFRNPANVAGWTVDMALLFGVEALFAGLLHGQFDDDDDWGTFFGHWLLETGKNMITMLPFVREVESYLEGYPTGGPIGAAAKRLGDAGKQVAQGEFDLALVKAINSAGGMLFHYPSSALNRIFTAGTKAAEGEDVPLLDYLIYREDRGESRR